MDQRIATDAVNHRNGDYVPIGDQEDPKLGIFDKPLPCFGCGIGWFFLVLGLVFPVMWYYAAFLYFGKYYHRDPRERSGLQASAIAELSLFSSPCSGDLYESPYDMFSSASFL